MSCWEENREHSGWAGYSYRQPRVCPAVQQAKCREESNRAIWWTPDSQVSPKWGIFIDPSRNDIDKAVQSATKRETRPRSQHWKSPIMILRSPEATCELVIVAVAMSCLLRWPRRRQEFHNICYQYTISIISSPVNLNVTWKRQEEWEDRVVGIWRCYVYTST